MGIHDVDACSLKGVGGVETVGRWGRRVARSCVTRTDVRWWGGGCFARVGVRARKSGSRDQSRCRDEEGMWPATKAARATLNPTNMASRYGSLRLVLVREPGALEWFLSPCTGAARSAAPPPAPWQVGRFGIPSAMDCLWTPIRLALANL
jgi:hypothetical protein